MQPKSFFILILFHSPLQLYSTPSVRHTPFGGTYHISRISHVINYIIILLSIFEKIPNVLPLKYISQVACITITYAFFLNILWNSEIQRSVYQVVSEIFFLYSFSRPLVLVKQNDFNFSFCCS